MKSSAFSCLIFILLITTHYLAVAKNDDDSHSFKIVGSKKQTLLLGKVKERVIKYDPASRDHILIIDFDKLGNKLTERKYLFTGSKFKMNDFGNYINTEQLMKDGTWKQFSGPDKISVESVFASNILQRKIFYYPNGHKKALVSGSQDYLNGPFKMWYENGQLSFLGYYHLNEKDGEFESYDQTGQLISKGIYENGKLFSGNPVVQDFVYNDPEVSAHLFNTPESFNKFLRTKTADLEFVQTLPEEYEDILDVKLSINKKGTVTGLKLPKTTSEEIGEVVKTALIDFSGFEPALMEGVPVRTVKDLQLVLTSQGLITNLSNTGSMSGANDTTDLTTYFTVEEMPEFPGGELALRKTIANNIRYPFYAQEHRIQGKIYVNFVIDVDGFVTEVRVVKGVHPVLDAEAVRVVNSLPKWKPGKQKGKFVRVSYTVPINFVLQ